MKKIEYRVLTEDDYDKLYELWVSQAMTKRAMNPVDDSKDGITRYIRRNPSTCFGAFEDENNEHSSTEKATRREKHRLFGKKH